MSEKRKIRDLKMANWENRIKLLTLVNQGWSIYGAARYLKMHHQSAYQIMKRIKGMSVDEAQKIADSLE